MTTFKRIALVIGTAVFTVALFVGATFYSQIRSVYRFEAGTKIAGIDISGETEAEALEVLNKKADEYLKTKIEIKSGTGALIIEPEALGVKIFPEKTLLTIRDAKKYGSSTEDYPLLAEVNGKILEQKLESIFKFKDRAPESANFYFEKGKLLIEQEKEGVIPEWKTLNQNLKKSAEKLSTEVIIVDLKTEKPAITASTLEAQKDNVLEQLNQKITLQDPVYSEGWDVKLKDHLDWVKFTEKQKVKIFGKEFVVDKLEEGSGEYLNTETYVAIEIDQEKLNEFIDAEISKWLDEPVENVNIYKNPEGKIVIEGRGQDGKRIDRAGLKTGIELALQYKINAVPIPVVMVKPQINIPEDLKTLGIKERISIGHTSYYGSPANRVHNIKTGAQRFNGALIAPDEVFSFNKTLGEVDASTGYKMELVIKPEGTIPEYGGGLCQVSTTVYRSAIFAGLPIIERNQHSYAVTYYSQILGHGMDATIYLGGADVKFKNDTGNYILMQAYVDKDYELYIILYGTSDGRSVKLEGPYISNHVGAGPTVYKETTELKQGQTKQTERAHGGFDVLWYRYITNASGEVTKESIETHYKAMPAKVMVGTGTDASSEGEVTP